MNKNIKQISKNNLTKPNQKPAKSAANSVSRGKKNEAKNRGKVTSNGIATNKAISNGNGKKWSVQEATDLYSIDTWGHPYFAINKAGNVTVSPMYNSKTEVDIYNVVEEIKRRKIELPCLIRFQDLLHRRVIELNESFIKSIKEFGYKNIYQGVYPIKVNQLEEVVCEILEAGEKYNFGIECGSKAELIAALAYMERDNMLMICNGYKDAIMRRMLLMGQQLGHNVIPIIEKYREFEEILLEAQKHDIKPSFGVRVRLSSSGSGIWAESGGDESKFGVSISDAVKIVNKLKSLGLEDSFKLVHFHIGSQIQDVMSMKSAVKEATRIYSKLFKLGIGVKYLDVGGGLGINYDAPESGLKQAINYSLQEYVNGVVYTIKEICDIEEVPHPIIVTESGRALTAHHSVLVVGVLGESQKHEVIEIPEITEDEAPAIKELRGVLNTLSSDATIKGENQRKARLLEAYHDAVEKRTEADQLFLLGYMSLEEKAKAEQLYWAAMNKMNELLNTLDRDYLPADLYEIEANLTDQYLCDFSVFQSMLDHWAIDQLFPIMPIHRLNEKPTQRATIVDLTCDSDGKVDKFISEEGEQSYLPLHKLNKGEDYYLGFFLMGAYQDILGDMHNLFGRVNEVHVYADEEEPNNFYIEEYIKGTKVIEALEAVQYFPSDLKKQIEAIIRKRVKGNKLRPKQGVEFLQLYTKALEEYTYYNFWNREK